MGPEARPLVEPLRGDPRVAPHEVATAGRHVLEGRPQDPAADPLAAALGRRGHAPQAPGVGALGKPGAGLGIDHGRAHDLAVGGAGGERGGGRVVVDGETGGARWPAGPEHPPAQGVGDGRVDALERDAPVGRAVGVGRGVRVGHGMERYRRPSMPPRRPDTTATGDVERRRARAVAETAVRLAQVTGRTLPNDLRLWALAGGRPTPDDSATDTREPATIAPGAAGGAAAGADLAAALEAATDGAQRRANGLHITPRWLADRLVARALEGLDATPAVTICDPACGGGAFLVAAARRLHRRGADRRRIVRHLLWGADIDPVGVAVAEAALAVWSGEAPPPGRLVVADALTGGGALWPDRPAAGFDVVVGNPPFQSQLARVTARSAVEQARLRQRYGSAVRAYTDAAWLFLVAGCELARPGGRVVLVQPQSLVGARDAAAVRARLDQRARLVDMWVDERPVFAAAVRVCAPVLEVAETRSGDHAADVGDARDAWAEGFADAVGIPRVAAARAHSAGTLDDLADVIAGFRDEYYGLADLVREPTLGTSADTDPPAPLVTSGLIDWLGCSWGSRPARFAKRSWQAPVVDLAALDRGGSHAARRWVARTRVPKLVVAAQTRVVEAAVDAAGSWVPSVPVLSVVPRDPADLWRLAAAVASPAATAWLLRRAPGTAPARGALKVAAPDLLALPLPVDRVAWDEAAAAARALATGPHRRDPAVCDRFLEAAAAAYATPPSLTAWWRHRSGLADEPPVSIGSRLSAPG